MKNLKKVLALVLVVASVLSFATVASAASFTDKDSITNTEAVNMLADLGVINGFTDGSYRPTETVTRAQMAKMIYAVCTGDDDASGFVGTTTALTDLNQAPWAEGYIKYCYSLGIINGFPDNTFRPNEPVTVAQAAKMLLVAVGYDSNEYVGASWSINTMRDAKAAKITKDVSASAALAASRDVSAQLIYNTMFADQVTPEYQYDMGVKYVTGYKKTGTTLAEDSFDMVKISGMVTSVAKDNVSIRYEKTGTDGKTTTTTENVKLAGSYDMLGKTGTVYMKNDNGKKVLYSTSVSVDDDIVLYTTVNGDDIYKSAVDSSKKQVTLNDEVTVMMNGAIVEDVAKSAFNVNDKNGKDYTVKVGEQTEKPLAKLINGKGTEVLYIDGDKDGNVDTIKITNYTAAKVSSYSTLNKTMALSAQIRSEGEGDDKVTYGDSNVSATYKFENIANYESFAKNDIVYAVKIGEGDNAVIDIYPTTKVEGKVSGKVASSSSVRVDGTTYAYNISGNATFAGQSIGDEGKFYLDANGYIVFADVNAAASVDKFAYVKKAAEGVSYDGYQKATLILTDGTEVVVDVEKYQAMDAEKPVSVEETPVPKAANIVVTFTVSDGKYTLKYAGADDENIETENGVQAFSGATIKKGEPQSKIGAVEGVTTSSTIYVDTENKAVYTGYNNVPSQNSAEGFVKVKGGKVELVFLTNSVSSGNDVKFFIYKANAYESYQNKDDETIRTYNAIVDGELTTIDIADGIAESTITGIGYYEGTVNTKGVVTALPVANNTTAKLPTEIGGDKSTVLTWNGEAYILNDDTIFYQVKDGAATVVDSAYLDISDIKGIYVQNAGTSDSEKITAKVVYIVLDTVKSST